MNKDHIICAFEAWITVHYDAKILNSVPEHPLFTKVLENMEDEECGEAASNCLRSIIYQLRDHEENKPLFEALAKCSMQIMQLIEHNISTC
jgi:hypothetical protein